ncbi:Sugar transport protein 5 [Linum perenne]
MAPIGGLQVNGGPIKDFGGKITSSVVVTCVVAASSGLIFGYDIGISGGVTTMEPFLNKFFPSVMRKAGSADTNIYCQYDSQLLTAFTSCLYIAGLAASLVASRVTASLGRKNTMILGGLTFLAGGAVNGGALNVFMLILGRILLGLGVGFTNQAAPLYLSEVAPAKWRGAFNAGFQFFIGIGVVVSNCINFILANHEWGWRVSLGLAVVPAAIMTGGVLLINDTPSSLVERGKVREARQSLVKIRGAGADVDGELDELVKWVEVAKSAEQEPFVTIFKRQYRPHLVMAIAIPFFQQVTGINIIAFYAPVLFRSVGFGKDSSLIASIILGLVNLVAILVSTGVVDRYGRRFLFIVGGFQMLVSKSLAIAVLILMCTYGAGFGWSWGPLSWLIPSEIFPIKIRTTGQSISLAINFATTFVLSQTFLAMLCHFKYGAFLFYAGWVTVMTLFIVFFLPETKGIPLDSMQAVWEQHWYWRRFVRAT